MQTDLLVTDYLYVEQKNMYIVSKQRHNRLWHSLEQPDLAQNLPMDTHREKKEEKKRRRHITKNLPIVLSGQGKHLYPIPTNSPQ